MVLQASPDHKLQVTSKMQLKQAKELAVQNAAEGTVVPIDASLWSKPFIIAGVACLIAAAIALMLKAPKHEEA